MAANGNQRVAPTGADVNGREFSVVSVSCFGVLFVSKYDARLFLLVAWFLLSSTPMRRRWRRAFLG